MTRGLARINAVVLEAVIEGPREGALPLLLVAAELPTNE
jgi:hypothetical protein